MSELNLSKVLAGEKAGGMAEMTFSGEGKVEKKVNLVKGKGIAILGKMMKIASKEKKQEDTKIVSLHPISHTVLRVSEKPLNLALFGLQDVNSRLEVIKAKKIQRIYNVMRQTTPTFSGAVLDYELNYLLELDLLKRLTPQGNIRVGLSPKDSMRFSSKFGVQEHLPYSHKMYEYLRGLIEYCKGKWCESPLEEAKK